MISTNGRLYRKNGRKKKGVNEKKTPPIFLKTKKMGWQKKKRKGRLMGGIKKRRSQKLGKLKKKGRMGFFKKKRTGDGGKKKMPIRKKWASHRKKKWRKMGTQKTKKRPFF